MTRNQVQRVPGTRDLVAQEYDLLRSATDRIGSLFGTRGYEMIDTPVLEETELFVRKSGGGLTGRLYSFVDAGGHRVSLRPEFTSSVIRCFVQLQGELSSPARLQYAGPVFRYENEGESGLRQFTQVGAELIGGAGVEADAEIISLALSGLEAVGLENSQVRIGNVGALRDLLSNSDLTETATAFVVAGTQLLKNGVSNVDRLMDRAAEVGILQTDGPHSLESDRADGEQHGEFLEQFISEALSSSHGRRTANEIVERLMRKTLDVNDPDKLKSSLELAAEVCRFEGDPEQVLDQSGRLARSRGLETGALDELGELVIALANAGVNESNITLDMGLARDISYYTGVTFDLFVDGSDGPVSVGGGGRYDGLVRALGGGDVPALGFAYTLDDVVDAGSPGA